VYADLVKQIEQRWSHVDERPALDIAMSASDLIKRVPLFEGLSADSLKAIGKLLKPRLALPDQRIPVQRGRTRAMYFVASGAVSLPLPDHTTAELGTGEFFGEIALLSGKDFATEARSLGYSRLLQLQARDFDALLARDAVLREKIEKVAKQRLRALEVWQEFQSGKRQYEPWPAAPADKAADDAAAAPLASEAEASSTAPPDVGPALGSGAEEIEGAITRQPPPTAAA
jgi:CPA1 family monovalent cation:H+ antiporter